MGTQMVSETGSETDDPQGMRPPERAGETA